MSLQSLCEQRELFSHNMTEAKKHTQYLRGVYEDNKECLASIEAFEGFMEQKREVFAHVQDMDNKSQKINELDKQIYYVVREILRYMGKEVRECEASIYFWKLRNYYETQEFIGRLKGRAGKYLSLIFWILPVIGAMILMAYFVFFAQYLPAISKDSALYYAFVALILGVLIALVLGMFVLYPIYAIHRIFYDIPRQAWYLNILFSAIVVSPASGLIILAILNIQPSGKAIMLVLCFVALMCICLKKMCCFSLEKIMLSLALSFMLMLDCLMIVGHVIKSEPDIKLIELGIISSLAIFNIALLVGILVATHFNVVKVSFWASVVFFVLVVALSGSFIVGKLHIGNYTAQKLVFTQEAQESIAQCQPIQGANNTLVLSSVKVISSLGEYILFECEGAKMRQKVPMRFVVGESSRIDEAKK